MNKRIKPYFLINIRAWGHLSKTLSLHLTFDDNIWQNMRYCKVNSDFFPFSKDVSGPSFMQELVGLSCLLIYLICHMSPFVQRIVVVGLSSSD